MLKDVGATANSVNVSEEYNPWSVFGIRCNQQVLSDLQPFQEKVVLRRKASRDTSGRWFGVQSAGSPLAGATVGRSGVRIYNIVEEGQVKNVVVPEPAASSSRSLKRSVIGIKRKASVPSWPMSREHFEVVSPVTSHRNSCADNPSFRAALNREASGSRRGSERDRRSSPIFEYTERK